jgi:signal transduction histidine kinase
MSLFNGKRPGPDSPPSMWWVGLLTVSLVWYVAASALPPGLGWIGQHVLLNISGAMFLALTLLLNLQKAGPGNLVNLAGQALCAMAFIAVDVSSTGPILNIVLVSQLPFYMSIRGAIAVAVLINLAHFVALQVFKGDSAMEAFLSTALFACFQMFSLLIGHYALQAQRARDTLAATNAQLLATRSLLESSARDRERLRVSRELHDTAGHMLTALKLNLRQLRDRSTPQDRVALEDCLKLSSDLLEDIRALVGNLREHDALNLQEALIALTRPFPQPRFTVEVEPGLAIDDIAIAENLLSVAREMITNVVRHAQAKQCTIMVRQNDGEVRLTVVDDGIGASGPEGFGIRGMRERLQDSNGGLEVLPNEPSGTRVSAIWARS